MSDLEQSNSEYSESDSEEALIIEENEEIKIVLKKLKMMTSSNYSSNIIYDGPPNLLNKALYNKDTNSLDVYLPNYIKNYQFDQDLVHNMIDRGYTEFDVSSIAYSYETDETKISSCSYFIPSQHFVSIGSKLPSDWKYTDAPVNPCCTHPKNASLGINSRCNRLPILSQCPIYEPVQWINLKNAVSQDTVIVSIQQSFVVPRIPKYKVIFTDTEKEFDSFTEADTYFTSCVDSYSSQLTIAVPVSTVENPYIETVLK